MLDETTKKTLDNRGNNGKNESITHLKLQPILTRTDELTNADKNQRETMFTSLQQKFRVYGVDLRRTHPYIYSQLIKWVENGGLFPHMTFYPKNSAGVDFLCILAGGKIQQWHPIHA